MTTLVAANLILWFSIFNYFMPVATDKQLSNDDKVVIEHKMNITDGK